MSRWRRPAGKELIVMRKAVVCLLAACLLLGGCRTQIGGVFHSPESAVSFEVPEETSSAVSSQAGVATSEPGASSSSASSKMETISSQGIAKPRTSSDQTVSKSPSLPKVAHGITYGYNQLTAAEKELYEQMASAIAALEPLISGFDPVNEASLKKVYYCVRADHPEYFWFPPQYNWQYDPTQTGNNIYAVRFRYIKPDKDGNPTDSEFTKAEVASLKPKLDAAVKTMLQGIPGDASDFEKVKIIHDRLIQNTEYVKTTNAYSIYGALVEKQAVCEGYSKAFSHLLSKLGIESPAVRGESIETGEGHQWNLVKIDGVYTHVDVTFDDPLIPGKPDNHVSYHYFGLTDREISSTHRVTGEQYDLPACTSTANNYYKQRELLLPNFESAAQRRLEAEAARAAQAGEASFSVRFTNAAAYQKACRILFTQEQIFLVLAQAGGTINPDTYYQYESGNFNILEIGFAY